MSKALGKGPQTVMSAIEAAPGADVKAIHAHIVEAGAAWTENFTRQVVWGAIHTLEKRGLIERADGGFRPVAVAA
jgi:hypothetical protein